MHVLEIEIDECMQYTANWIKQSFHDAKIPQTWVNFVLYVYIFDGQATNTKRAFKANEIGYIFDIILEVTCLGISTAKVELFL